MDLGLKTSSFMVMYILLLYCSYHFDQDPKTQPFPSISLIAYSSLAYLVISRSFDFPLLSK